MAPTRITKRLHQILMALHKEEVELTRVPTYECWDTNVVWEVTSIFLRASKQTWFGVAGWGLGEVIRLPNIPRQTQPPITDQSTSLPMIAPRPAAARHPLVFGSSSAPRRSPPRPAARARPRDAFGRPVARSRSHHLRARSFSHSANLPLTTALPSVSSPFGPSSPTSLRRHGRLPAERPPPARHGRHRRQHRGRGDRVSLRRSSLTPRQWWSDRNGGGAGPSKDPRRAPAARGDASHREGEEQRGTRAAVRGKLRLARRTRASVTARSCCWRLRAARGSRPVSSGRGPLPSPAAAAISSRRRPRPAPIVGDRGPFLEVFLSAAIAGDRGPFL